MRKQALLLILLTFLLASFVWPATAVCARENEAGPAAQLTASLVPDKPKDERVEKLTAYLKYQNSPLADEAQTFIEEAEKNDLDWRLVPAIAGIESTYGKRIPTKSYNAWGWGVFTGQSFGVVFPSWSDGIAQVSEGLKKGYIDRGATTIYSIGRWYASSPTWAGRVSFLIEDIEHFSSLDPDLIKVSL